MVVVTGVQVAAAVAVLGRPDFGLGADFVLTTSPTSASTLAAIQLIIWMMVASTCVLTLLPVAPLIRSSLGRVRATKIWAVAVFATGMIVFGGGAFHHYSSQSLSMAGGSLGEARSELDR
jgi:hypothetical protein